MALNKYTKEFRYNLKLAVPVIAGMVGHTLVQLFDNIMVGQLGTAELAAVSLGNSFIFIAMSIGIGFSTAITPLVAEADGEQDTDKGKQAFKHGLFLCTILGITLFGLVLLSKPLMYFMDQPEEVVALAIPYLDLVAFSLVPLIMFQALKQFSDGLSETKYPMYATILANVVNIALNYLLIFGKFGFPKMGIVGAAVGTLVSRFVMLGFLWFMFGRKKKFLPYVSKLNFRIIHTHILRKIMSLGFPSAMQMFFEVAIFTAAIWLNGIIGKNAQAANNIALNLSSFTFMFVMGLGAATMIRVGNQKGLKRFRELRRIAFSFFLMAFIIQSFFGLLFTVFHESLPWIYMNEDNLIDYENVLEVAKIASNLLIVAAIFQVSDGIQVVVLGALRGLQDVKIPTLITFIAYWIIGFPISYYLGLKTDFGSTGIWIGLLAGLTASAIMLYIRFNLITKELIRTKEINQ
ncbi:MATE family efflux transporter [Leptobacterium flavescens]|uniref:Multidrug-efflux transporter n=1 Tax=Leptobacterium flavescens TaxID=472055 RepID=A0A6P0UID7_9FLAO|nr:MATE family efflux transporter [Leptobacterium flavescens]NER12220.1 MATE family efflux transporter [Leptobacterium flavescens]